MKKSILSLFIIAAIFMVPILSFEASALTAYGQPCTANSECTSGVCHIVLDLAKDCGCTSDSHCSNSKKCNTATNFCMNTKVAGAICTTNSECYSGSCTSGRCAAGEPVVNANVVNGIVCETGFPGYLDHLDAFGTMIKVNKRMLTGDTPSELASSDLPATQISVYGLTSAGALAWTGIWEVATGDRGTSGMLTVKVTRIFPNPVSAGNRCADITATRATITAASPSSSLSVMLPAPREATAVVTPAGGPAPTVVGTACTTNSDCPATQICAACPTGARCTSTNICRTPTATECNSGLTCVSGRCEGQKANNAVCTKPSECTSGICHGTTTKKCSTVCAKNDECANGKTCDLNTGTCITPRSKAVNAACFQNDVCVSGFCYNSKCMECRTNNECLTPGEALGQICTSGRCEPLLENRATCNNPYQCKSGICAAIVGTAKKCGTVCSKDEHCAGGKVCDLNTGTCIAARSKDTNAACFQNDVCKSNLCFNSKCIASCGTTVVTGVPAGGGTGGTSAATECNSGLTCVSGRCSGEAAKNAACTSPYQCKSGICRTISSTSRKCDVICMKNDDCANGKTCDLNTGTCIAPRSKATNAACFQNDVCVSGFCYNSKCMECRTNNECLTPGEALGQICTSGRCEPLLENRAACNNPYQCKSGICAAIVGTAKKCGTVCSKAEHCANEKICDLNTGTCIAAKSKAANAACFQNEVCVSGLCFNSKCIASCGGGTTFVQGQAGAVQSGTGTPSDIQSLIDEIDGIIAGIKARMMRLRI